MATSSRTNMDTNTPQQITWRQIYWKPGSLFLPFRLTLPQNNGVALCKKILRLLPKRRITFLGEWQGKAVIIKLFIEPGRAAQHIARERAGIQALLETGTPTPRLLYDGHTQRYRIPLLITEYQEGSTDLLHLWQGRSSNDDITPLMETVTIELATQHVQGVLQHDLHFGNLLVKNNTIYSLDGSSIEFFNSPLQRKQSLEHLALFFAQLGAGTQKLQQHLLKIYTDARAWPLNKSDLRHIKKRTCALLQRREKSVRKKSLRTNSGSRCVRGFFTQLWYNRHSESPELIALLKNPESAFQNADAHLLKQGRSTTLVRFEAGQQSLVVKRYNIKSTLHWLRRMFRPTRAVKCWQYAHALQLAGIATAKPIAAIEKRFLGLRAHSYFISEHVEGPSLDEWFADYTPHDPRFARVAQRVSDMLSALHALHISHGDMKATNIIIRNEYPVLIDLDGMKKQRNNKKDRQRFMRNWASRPDIAALFGHIKNG